MIDLIAVQSSMLAAAGYDPQTRILIVLFNSGKAYEYYDVPPEVHRGLMESESKGKYMNANVIGVYRDAPFRGWSSKALAPGEFVEP